MTIARKHIVIESFEGVYHCTSRCVRRAFLCGDDHYTGQNYDHRKAWVQGRLKELSAIFCVDICGYSVLSNHVHVILRNRPDRQDALSKREVADRWRTLYPKQFGSEPEAHERMLEALMANGERLSVLRHRLGSISWFMKCLNEPIARQANREDHCKGHFWEGRFRCQVLLDEAAVLACMTYVDLNPIRAGVAKTPEASNFTSAHDHIEHFRAEAAIARLKAKRTALTAKNKKLSKRRKIRLNTLLNEEQAHLRADSWLAPVEASQEIGNSQHGVTSLTLEQYLELLDWTGRRVVAGKRGAIPETMLSIFKRLKVDGDRWGNTVTDFGRLFHLVAGHVPAMMNAAHRAGQRWFQGLHNGGEAFPEWAPPG